jgi:hypothetical protein
MYVNKGRSGANCILYTCMSVCVCMYPCTYIPYIYIYAQIELIGKARTMLARIQGGAGLLRGMSDICGDQRMSFAEVVKELERMRLRFAFA